MNKNIKIGNIVKDEKGNLYKVLALTNTLFIVLEDLKTKQLIISSDNYYLL